MARVVCNVALNTESDPALHNKKEPNILNLRCKVSLYP